MSFSALKKDIYKILRYKLTWFYLFFRLIICQKLTDILDRQESEVKAVSFADLSISQMYQIWISCLGFLFTEQWWEGEKGSDQDVGTDVLRTRLGPGCTEQTAVELFHWAVKPLRSFIKGKLQLLLENNLVPPALSLFLYHLTDDPLCNM